MNDKAAVHLHNDGSIAVITIDNPPVNTIDAGVRAGLGRCLDELKSLGDIEAVLLRCAGKTFCSGADIGEFHGPPKEAEYREGNPEVRADRQRHIEPVGLEGHAEGLHREGIEEAGEDAAESAPPAPADAA